MHDVTLFPEDFAHEAFLQPLVRRIAAELGVQVELHVRGPRGGASRLLAELSAYVKDIDRGRELLPAILIICRDANCQGYNHRKHEIDPIVQHIADRVVYAIPEPHIERWMLIDPSAFKKAVGKGCQVPDQKCQRDRYKRLLIQSIQEAGLAPLLGGMEHAEAIVMAMDLQRISRREPALGQLLVALENHLRQWKKP